MAIRRKTEPSPKSSGPAIEDAYLKLFQKNNSHCRFLVEDDKFILQNPWGEKDCRIAYDLSDVESIKELNHLAFNPQFDAIIHIDQNEIEFICGYLIPDKDPSKAYLDRVFTLHFNGIELNCRFAKPTERLMTIARRVRRLPSESAWRVVPQLDAFADSQRLKDLPKRATEYFAKRVPRSFYVRPSKPIIGLDLEQVSRHINFAMRYFDRSTPEIEVRARTVEGCAESREPRRFSADDFPPSINMQPIDEFMLQLIEVARHTSPRFAFIYYFQVIEYAGFYFVDEKTRRTLKSFLRDPAMITCPEDRMHELFGALSELAHNDETRMKKVVEECCNPAIIWKEIENDKSYFCGSIHFDGGFVLPALIASDTSLATWSTMWMPKLYDHLTKIRNCLVHAREKRQSNVILPTAQNNCRIERYLPVIARIAEEIALKTD